MAQNTISDELNRLIQAKADIKSALEEKGLTIGDSSTLDEFPALIQDMPTGSGGYDVSTVIDLIEGDVSGGFVIPNGTTKIKKSCFESCTNLSSITIPSSVTNIDQNAFYLCNGLHSITIPSSVLQIGQYAFYNCSRIHNITIPNGVTYIFRSCFESCINLSSITIPSSVTNIDQNAFSGCTGLQEMILLPTTIPTLPTNSNKNPLGQPSYTFPIYVKNEYVNTYKNAGGGWSGYSSRITPLASMSYDASTYTVTALGRDNLELYVDASLINSSVYTFDSTTQTGNHTVTVKSVDPSLGVLDTVTQEILIEASTPKLGAPTITINPDRNVYIAEITNTDSNANTIMYKVDDGEFAQYLDYIPDLTAGQTVYAYAVDSTGTYANSDTVSATVSE